MVCGSAGTTLLIIVSVVFALGAAFAVAAAPGLMVICVRPLLYPAKFLFNVFLISVVEPLPQSLCWPMAAFHFPTSCSCPFIFSYFKKWVCKQSPHPGGVNPFTRAVS